MILTFLLWRCSNLILYYSTVGVGRYLQDLFQPINVLCYIPRIYLNIEVVVQSKNQILNGILDSKVSIFQCTDEIDAGPILAQRPLSLRGELSEIIDRIEHGGFEATLDILNGEYKISKQDKEDVSYYQRHPLTKVKLL